MAMSYGIQLVFVQKITFMVSKINKKIAATRGSF